MIKIEDRLGEENINNQGCLMKIIEYNSYNDVKVEFQDKNKYKCRARYYEFKIGKIKNRYHKSVYGIGYLGEGEFPTSIKGKSTNYYNHWHSMLKRCYDKNFIYYDNYKDCFVFEDWYNFQVFAKWFDENRWSEDCLCVDKDILIKGNKVYSPETCVLVDNKLNGLFIKADQNRGNCPIGVYYKKSSKRYGAICCLGGEFQRHLGFFDNQIDAFNCYKNAKELYIKQIAEEYKQKYPQFPTKLYDAMYNYEVEITD